MKIWISLLALLVSACAQKEVRPQMDQVLPPNQAVQAPEGMKTRQQIDSEMIASFKRLDKNKSQSLERDEYWRLNLGQWDQNKDGKIKLTEFLKASDKQFSTVDQNKDDILTAEEQEAFHKNFLMNGSAK